MRRRDFLVGVAAAVPAAAAAQARGGGRMRSVDMHSHWSPDQPPDEVNKPLYVDRDKRLLKL